MSNISSEEMECWKKRNRQVILCDQDVAPEKAALTVNCRRPEAASSRISQKIRQFTTARQCLKLKGLYPQD
jgi:hypothetical protein